MWNNTDRARQLIDFDDLDYKATDIDCICDLREQGYIVVEYKHGSTQLPTGQKILFQKMSTDVRKPILIIVAEHYDDDPMTNVRAGHAKTRQICWRGKWITRYNETVNQTIEKYMNWMTAKPPF